MEVKINFVDVEITRTNWRNTPAMHVNNNESGTKTTKEQITPRKQSKVSKS